MSSSRILVVDDHEKSRQVISSMLRGADFHFIAQASDGLEAIQKAEELQPDLILLDIGLPTLNGIEAAKRIRKLAPHARIVFVSQESSPDIVEETLRLGAMGYVHKARTGSELLPAVEAVLAGRQFVGSSLKGCERREGKSHSPFCHEVQFYSDDAVFMKNLGRAVHSTLEIGGRVIAVTTPGHRAALVRELELLGFDSREPQAEGRYISLDARETLSQFVVDRMPDLDRFTKVVGDIIDRVSSSACTGVTVFGEMVALLWADGDYEAAIHLEQLWNELATKRSFSLSCAYPVLVGGSQSPEQNEFITRVCAQHSAVYSG